MSSCFGPPQASENFRNICEYRKLDKDKNVENLNGGYINKDKNVKNFSGGYNEDIRNFYELQRISR